MKYSKCATLAVSMAFVFALASCGGMMLSTDFGIDDYVPADTWYWPNYGGFYYGPGAYWGPAWNLPPLPRPIYPDRPGFQPSSPPNSVNRPNFVPSGPVNTTPSGAERPGNMGQGPSSKPGNSDSGGASDSRRGR